MAFRPAPPVGTRLGVDGQDWLSGDVLVLPGVGTEPRRSMLQHGLIIDSKGADPNAPASLYIPDVSTMPQLRLRLHQPETYLQLAEALIVGDPPASGSSEQDCWGIVIEGTSSGLVTVELAEEGGRRFAWDSLATSELVSVSDSPASVSSRHRGAIQKLKVTSEMTIGAVQMSGRAIPDTNPQLTAGLPKIVEILNADRTEILASSDYFTFETATNVWTEAASFTVPLTHALELDTDQEVWVGIRVEGDIGTGVQWWGDTPGAETRGDVQLTLGSAGYKFMEPDDTGTWLNPTKPLRNGPNNSAHWFRLYGAGGGTLIRGDLLVSTADVGTPPNAPTGINLRLQWALSESGL